MHKQVKITHGKMSAEVDEGIAELILEIWKHGIDTIMSCEENQQGTVWIDFLTVNDGERFLNLVGGRFPSKAKKPWETLYGRIFGFGTQGDWSYNLCINDLNATPVTDENEDIVEYEVSGRAEVYFSLSIRFPQSDIPLILKRLRKKIN